jgi:hypothetical protein
MKKKSHLPAAAIILSANLAILPSALFGQGKTWAGASLAQAVEATKWKVSWLLVNASLALNRAGYDSDIYYGYRENPIPDMTFSADIPIQVFAPLSKSIMLDLMDTPQYLFYLDTKSERAWNNVFQGHVHMALERLYFQVGGGLSNIRQRLSSELNINVRQRQGTLNGTLLWQASQATSFAIIYDKSKYDFGGDEFDATSLAETLNRKEDHLDVIAYLQPNSRLRLSLNGQYGEYFFKSASAKFKDSQSYGIFGGLNFVPQEGEARPIEPLQGSIGLGFKRLDITDPAFADGSGFVGTVSISSGLFRRTTGRVAFSRDYRFSFLANAAYYTSTSYGGGVTRSLSRRVSASYDISFDRGSYPEDETGDGTSPGVNVRYMTHLIGFYIRTARNMVISLEGTLGKRMLGEPALVRDRNFFCLSLVYGNPPRQVSSPVSSLGR